MVRMPGFDLSARYSLLNFSQNFVLESTLKELPLCNLQFDISCICDELVDKFKQNISIPGVLLVDKGEFVGMISRRRFLEDISIFHKEEIFTERPFKAFYQSPPNDTLILPGDTSISVAAKQYLEHYIELLWDPIVVKLSSDKYSLLDIHQLLTAQYFTHELATKSLLDEINSKLLQTEKFVTLGRTVAGIAHEIRNPVNCIGGNLPFLSNYFRDLTELISIYEEEDSNSSAKIQEIKDKIDFNFLMQDVSEILTSSQVASERLTQLVRSLQNFSHMERSKSEPTDIHKCIDGTLLILKNQIKQGIQVIKNYGNLPLINCCPGLISQVFMNLLSNAIDAVMEKASRTENWQPCIEITTSVVERNNSQNVTISIIDNGVGIQPEIQKQIFQSFFTTKPIGKGTGLGLAISHEIVTQSHKGQLLVKSQPGVGSEFDILLPLAINQDC